MGREINRSDKVSLPVKVFVKNDILHQETKLKDGKLFVSNCNH